jgi:hypothetical protein
MADEDEEGCPLWCGETRPHDHYLGPARLEGEPEDEHTILSDQLSEAVALLKSFQHIGKEWFNTPGDWIRLEELARDVDLFLDTLPPDEPQEEASSSEAENP